MEPREAALDPRDRPPLQPGPLIRCLEAHRVNWVMCGSQVLALHGARLQPNDLDVVPDLDPDNLGRVAQCLRDLNAVAAYLDGWGGARGSYEACLTFTPDPPTAERLDWLFVTRLGMLDIVIENAAPYAMLMAGASRMKVGGIAVNVCDPRDVLRALEPRARKKDAERQAVYREMRAKFGLPPLN